MYFIRKTQKYMQFASKIKRLWIFYRPSYNYQQLKQWQKRDGKFLKSVKSLKIRLNILRGYCDFSYREILRRRTIIIALNKSQTSILSKPYLADRKYHLFRDPSTSSFSSSSTSLVRYYLENPGGSQARLFTTWRADELISSNLARFPSSPPRATRELTLRGNVANPPSPPLSSRFRTLAGAWTRAPRGWKWRRGVGRGEGTASERKK